MSVVIVVLCCGLFVICCGLLCAVLCYVLLCDVV